MPLTVIDKVSVNLYDIIHVMREEHLHLYSGHDDSDVHSVAEVLTVVKNQTRLEVVCLACILLDELRTFK